MHTFSVRWAARSERIERRAADVSRGSGCRGHRVRARAQECVYTCIQLTNGSGHATLSTTVPVFPEEGHPSPKVLGKYCFSQNY